MIHPIDKLIINHEAREWCKLPYTLHPKGCPNYGKKDDCPPSAVLIEDFIDTNGAMSFVSVEFDLASHVKRMLDRHPNWSDRQARCVLYWQPKVNRQLLDDAIDFSYLSLGSVFTLCPEAMGVNVIETAQRCGIPMQVHPVDTIYKVALFGYPRKD